MEYPIHFDRFSRVLMTPLGMGARHSQVVVQDDVVQVRMGWAFRATFPLVAVVGCQQAQRVRVSRGVHGWRGRWLVNGAGRPLLDIELAPGQRCRVVGWRVRLTHLIVSTDDPDGLAWALQVQ